MGRTRSLPRSPRLRATLACGLCWLAGVTISACSATPTGTFTLTTGGETDALSRAPTPTSLVVEDLAVDGTKTELSRTRLPASSLALGTKRPTDVGALVVRALDDAGRELLHGETLYFQFGALADATLSVFLQRNGEFARLPRPFPQALAAGPVTVVADRYLVSASLRTTSLYDLLQLTSISQSPTLDRSALSLTGFGTSLVAIDEAGASAVDLTTNTGAVLEAPSGGTFADVAGGSTVSLPDGSSFVVGPTRALGPPTTRILYVAQSGALSFVDLVTPRSGACATWAPGRGLVVVGGSDEGAGAEVVDAVTHEARALPYPADPTSGCGAATIDDDKVLVAGGTLGTPLVASPVRVFALGCDAACVPSSGPLGPALVHAEAASVASDAALFVGDDAAGTTHAFRATPTALVEVPLRSPRSAGHLLRMPTGGVAVIGGATTIEQYRE